MKKGVDISRGSTYLLVNKHSKESFYPGKKRLGSTYLLVNKYWGVLVSSLLAVVSSLLAEGFVEEPPRKELVIAPFVKRFKAATLRKTH